MWLLLCFLSFLFSVSSKKTGEPPKHFSDSYATKGTLYVPYAEIREPFYAWYDSRNKSSRIDYYGGMVKTYQLGQNGLYGTSIKIAPITTEEVQNADTCFKVTGSSELPIEPQTTIPNIDKFKFDGQEMVNGILCHKWTLTNTYEAKVNKYTMWTQAKNSRNSQGKDTAIPVRYEMKGFNTLLGSHYDHYYLDYDWYSPESPNPKVFEVENYTCQNFPGPGQEHVLTFNPMKEFVNNYNDHVHCAFEDFKKTHNKSYSSTVEHAKRLDIFRQNLRFIHSHNRARKGFTLGINHLADKNDLELKAFRGYKPTPGVKNSGKPFPYSSSKILAIKSDLPDALDWRLNGAVTPVKDQSVCGSCWSFGTSGAVEGAYFLKYGNLVRLSQQALIDCSWGFGNNGCDGGEDFRSYDWILKHGGVPTEDDYGPYLGQDGYCHVSDSMKKAKIKGYVNVTSNNVDALKFAVAIHGPISVAIDASHKTFSFYSNGVYYEPKCGNKPMDLDHAVLVVGYGKLNDKNYWLIKNSWSNYWGNDGYVLMSQDHNNCGVTTNPTYVIM